ncbi:MAG: hypothetical protein U9Q71_08730 [Pseudomonadota bacterium]|nr:hypothetical protein [Pseudomonadota bacterium]
MVLTPSSTGSTDVYVLDSSGKKLDKGRYVGRTNGNRATYRFSRGGRGFPDPSYLKVGSSIYKVKRPGSRHSC